MIIAGKDLAINMQVKFKTINTYDQSYKTGQVRGFVTYEEAAMLGDDLIAYHAEVLKDNSLVDDAKTLNYMLLKLSSGERMAVAIEWIEPTSLTIIEVSNNVTIKIFNVPSQEAGTILQILRDVQYVCKQIS